MPVVLLMYAMGWTVCGYWKLHMPVVLPVIVVILDQLDVHTAISVQASDFSTLYTSIPHKLLKSRKAALVHNSLKKKGGSTRYTHIKVGQRKGYFINSINGGGGKTYTADQIRNMTDFSVDNIFVNFGDVYFVKLLESLWERIVLHCSLTCFFTHMKVNF